MVITMKSMYTILMFFCMALAALVKASVVESKPAIIYAKPMMLAVRPIKLIMIPTCKI